MHNGRKTNMNTRQPRPGSAVCSHTKRWPSNAARRTEQLSQHTKKNYQRYLALARAEVQSGNTVAAENYYQQGKHCVGSMSSDKRSDIRDSLQRLHTADQIPAARHRAHERASGRLVCDWQRDHMTPIKARCDTWSLRRGKKYREHLLQFVCVRNNFAGHLSIAAA